MRNGFFPFFFCEFYIHSIKQNQKPCLSSSKEFYPKEYQGTQKYKESCVDEQGQTQKNQKGSIDKVEERTGDMGRIQKHCPSNQEMKFGKLKPNCNWIWLGISNTRSASIKKRKSREIMDHCSAGQGTWLHRAWKGKGTKGVSVFTSKIVY